MTFTDYQEPFDLIIEKGPTASGESNRTRVFVDPFVLLEQVRTAYNGDVAPGEPIDSPVKATERVNAVLAFHKIPSLSVAGVTRLIAFLAARTDELLKKDAPTTPPV